MSLFKREYEDLRMHDAEGNEYLYTLLFRLKSDYSNKFIAVVTEYETDEEDGSILTQAFYYIPEDSSGKIENIDEDSKDWDLIDKFLRYYQSPFKWFLVNIFLKRSL